MYKRVVVPILWILGIELVGNSCRSSRTTLRGASCGLHARDPSVCLHVDAAGLPQHSWLA